MSSVRISELSDRTGVAVPTLKYYRREGLLPSGVATAVNQADYDEGHVRRVRLIRSLLELGKLSIADVRSVLSAVDDESVSVHEAFGTAQDAMVNDLPRDSPTYRDALDEVDRFVRRHRLRVRPEAAVRGLLADAIVFLGAFGQEDGNGRVETEIFDGLLATALAQAEFEIASVPDVSRAEQVEYSVVGTVAFEIAAAALRRMALEHESAKRFGTPRRRGAGRGRTSAKQA